MNKYSKMILAGALVALFLAAIYRPALDNGFTGDDKYLYVKNDFIKNWRNIPRLFQQDYLSSLDKISLLGHADIGSGELTYRPVCTFSYFCDYSIWKLDLWGPHLTNVLLHVINVFLVFFLALRLNLSGPAAIFTALVFAVHPVNNEVVAVITSRDDMLAFGFFALAILFYQKFRNSRHQSWGYYLASLLMYLLAVFTKEVALTLPIILILIDQCFPPQKEKRPRDQLKFYSGYVLILWGYFLVYAFFMRPSRIGIIDYFAGDWLSFGATVVNIVALYLSWLLVPWNIPATIADTGIIVKDFYSPQFLVSLAVILALGACLFLAFKRQSRRILFAFSWSLITILPALIALPWMLNVLYAARFLYVPMIGFCIVLGLTWDMAVKYSKRPLVLYCVSAVLLSSYIFVTVNKLPVWKDDLTLSLQRLRDYPRSTLALLNAGAAFEERAMPEEAEALYQQAVNLDPRCGECQNQLGLLKLNIGDLENAVGFFRQAVLADPAYETGENNLCSTLGQQKKYREAEDCFLRLIAKHGRYVSGYYNLGVTYAQEGKIEEALKIWGQGLEIEPANVLLREAVAHFVAKR